MEQKKDLLIVKLFIGLIVGIGLGLVVNEPIIGIVQAVKYIAGQVIFFVVPLIIVGFITPAITKLKNNAGGMLGTMIGLAYASSLGAALFSIAAGYSLIPLLQIQSSVEGLKELPKLLFRLDIPAIFPVMTALVLALSLGMAVLWTKSQLFESLLDELQNIVMFMVQKIVVPIMPIFVASTFALLAYEGRLTKQLPVFIVVVFIVLVGHLIWLAVLYSIAGLISRKNPLKLLKYYGPAYLTAVGTMSSAATLPVSLECVRKSEALNEEVSNFAIPLGATIHLCGSVLTEVFFVMTISQVLYGTIPPASTMIFFSVLLSIFAVGAPGVPGGTVIASLGLISSILGFDDTGIALVLTVFALQDSFGTACNVTGDGALALMLEGIFHRKTKST
ncbi:MAG: dicarboxylate/amino acid:cation symporter [Brevinema sp.]